MIPPIAALAGSKAPGVLMVASGTMLAFLQDTTAGTEQTASTVIQIVAMVLGAGGVGYLLIKTGASEYSKSKERQREIDREEREEDREAKRVAQLNLDRLIGVLEAQGAYWRDLYKEERAINRGLPPSPINHETGPISKEG